MEAPSGTNNLPRPRSPLFIGRDGELEKLRESVESNRGVVVAQMLQGLGGVGKTTLALHYAHAFKERYSLIWWISAENHESVTSGLASLALRLNHLLGSTGSTSTEISEWAISWLQSHSDWLLILDNADSLDVISSIIGQTRGGHYLITSRVTVGWDSIASQINLDVLSVENSVELITRISGVAGEEECKKQIAIELGCLPLAIEQAAAYINYTKSSCARYLDLLVRVPAKAFSAAADLGANSTTVAKTWQVTLKSIEDRDPLALRILRILAWVGSVDIPREVTYSFADESFDVDSALGLLSAYSMVSLSADSVSIHRLVQAVIRASEESLDTSSPHPHEEAAIGIYNVLDLEPETAIDSWPMWRRILPHIEALETRVTVSEASGALRTVLYFAARFLKAQGQAKHALRYAQKCVQMAECEGEKGSGGLDLLSCRNILGGTLQAVGRHREAVEVFRSLVRDSDKTHGPVEPFTLSMKNNLASAYQDAGLMEEAIDLFERTLTEREENLPADDPGILTSRHNLASAYGIHGQLHRSIPLLERVVEDRSRLLGYDSVGALNSMSVLAEAYRKCGKLVQSANIFKRVLSTREEILDEEDPSILRARQKLADVYRQAGNAKRAVPLYRKNLEVIARVCGIDDPRTIEIGVPLAFAYQDAKQYDKAVLLLRRFLEWRESHPGEDPESVVIARNNLAVAHWLAGSTKIAAELFRHALSDADRLLKDDDKATRIVRANLHNLMSGMPVTRAGQFDVLRVRSSVSDFSPRSV
ncbi:FxSxx-COOH system tetratricopeptide repeat protein [Streptomyces cellulosae]|uniref:FxSxx-COOH system tetratricopeptide repeat protein n=1 Tax=Streptomyces cellulosae TaxID=1968 RepID=UPI002252C6E9|nr:FxSxx-COOH system tetratricopeptide repeat protein [Streptomyces cellulosae]WTB86180.1 FxSxx-COOH system tetratricopeptide repeat protein [Streptomyces cellulosae]